MTGDGDQLAHALWLILALMLVTSAMIGRRMPLARMICWASAWAALFLGLFILFRWFEPEIIAWEQSRRPGQLSVVTSDAATVGASGQEVSIPVARDGHYWVDATVNGEPVRFLIDSGASVTALSEATAKRLDLPADPMGRTMRVQTANGAVTARRATVERLDIGPIRATGLPVIVSATFGEVNVLGMNFLNKLSGWRVSEGRMILEAR